MVTLYNKIMELKDRFDLNGFNEDIAKTIILAVVGATVSFMVSLLLKWLTKSKK
jgi:hypothetical protein